MLSGNLYYVRWVYMLCLVGIHVMLCLVGVYVVFSMNIYGMSSGIIWYV